MIPKQILGRKGPQCQPQGGNSLRPSSVGRFMPSVDIIRVLSRRSPQSDFQPSRFTTRKRMSGRERRTCRRCCGWKIYVIAYDPEMGAWSRKADLPTPKGDMLSCTVNGKIYVIGGFGGKDNPDLLKSVEEYDPATDTWLLKTRVPTPRVLFGVSVMHKEIYVIGGNVGTPFATVYAYDLITDTF